MQPEAEKIIQNLQDADCPPELIETFSNWRGGMTKKDS